MSNCSVCGLDPCGLEPLPNPHIAKLEADLAKAQQQTETLQQKVAAAEHLCIHGGNVIGFTVPMELPELRGFLDVWWRTLHLAREASEGEERAG